MTRNITRYNLSEIRRIRIARRGSDAVMDITPDKYVHNPSKEMNDAETMHLINQLIGAIKDIKKHDDLAIELDFWEE